jgi:deltex-like protein
MKSLATGMIDYARKYYPLVDVKHVEGIQVTISGVAHDVTALQKQYSHHVARNIQSVTLVPPPVSESALCPPAVHVDSTVRLDPLIVDSTASGASSTIKEYPNLNPDVLALLQKIPEGKIPGLRYDIKRGSVVVDSCSSEEETLRISTFQAKYQEIVSSRKLRVDALEVPETLSDRTVKEVVSSYDAKYNQCVFIIQEDSRAVRIISNSSRQFEQVKKMLKDGLNQAAVNEDPSATSVTSSKYMVIPLAGGRKLTLKQADIVMEEVDVIVNAANKNLDHGAGVAGALNRASNGAMQRYSERYIKKNGQLFPGQVAVTLAGGSLKCRHIIHAIGPTNHEHNLTVCERLLHDVMNRVLQEAEKVSAKSIAIPAISSGIFGVGKELVAKCITDSIQSYNFRKPLPTLSDIRIVIIDHPTHRVFAQLFATRMAIMAHSNPDPHRSATHPLSSSSDKVVVLSSPTPSRNATDMMSLPKEHPKGVPSGASATSKGIILHRRRNIP